MSTRPNVTPFPVVAWLDRRTRFQKRLALTAFLIVVLFLIARIVGRMALDLWWFDTITTADVWATRVGAQVLMLVAGVLIAGVVIIGSAIVSGRSHPAPGNRANRVVISYRQRMGPAHNWALIGLAAVITVRQALAAMNQWQTWLLFSNSPGLDSHVPAVGWDLGYHLFRLPFVIWLSDWLRVVGLWGLGFAVAGYLSTGALKLPRAGRKSSRRAVMHLGFGVATLALVQAFYYIFVSWPRLASGRFGNFDGAGFTQVRFVIPSFWILSTIALITCGLIVWAAITRRWRPALISAAVWLALQLLLIGVVPSLVNRFVVKPAEATRQLPYIAHNLEATRMAYSMSAVEEVTAVLSDGLETPPPAGVEPDLNRMPLFTEASLVSPLQVLKGTTGTRITDVDLDRYELDGVRRPVFIAARNANRADLPEKGWVQEHLVYTHGDGVVAVPADSTSPDGRPDVDAFSSELEGVRPELYFGENLKSWYVIVGTDRTELGGSVFSGDTAIELNTLGRRLALSLTVGQIEPLVSAELGADSELLFRRDVVERLSYLAPFLSFDANPYPTVVDGHIIWLVDGYTRSSHYPYAQFARNVGLSAASGMASRSFNYMHASIRATVDAYDGTVHLYRTEIGGGDDPILDAWEDVYPGLIEPISEMPDEVRSHLLYPQDMLTVQTAMLGRYHVTDAETLFSGADSWAISVAAGDGVARASTTPEDKTRGPAAAVSLFMPTTEALGDHWVAIRPYGPGSATNPTSTRDELSALAIADHDDPESLTLVRIEVDTGRLISSPSVAQAAIDTDGELATLFTLLNANGSKVEFGPMTPIPINGALVWARSIVVTGTAQTTAPNLYGVAAVSNGLVGQADTTAEAVTRAATGS